ncbi:hypothetical protein HJC22_43370, partial [Corallococcus exiguus]|uniref:hypothetical protein n=2 Tax=Corallococcus exiguus TaxID=83462 RepID=UPI001470A2C7
MPAGMVRLLSGQLVTEEDASQVIPGDLPPEARWPTPTDVTADVGLQFPGDESCSHADELERVRAELARRDEALLYERESRVRAEAELSGFARAVSLLVPALAVPGVSRPPVPMVVP